MTASERVARKGRASRWAWVNRLSKWMNLTVGGTGLGTEHNPGTVPGRRRGVSCASHAPIRPDVRGPALALHLAAAWPPWASAIRPGFRCLGRARGLAGLAALLAARWCFCGGATPRTLRPSTGQPDLTQRRIRTDPAGRSSSPTSVSASSPSAGRRRRRAGAPEPGHGAVEAAARARQPLVDVDQLVLADEYDIAIVEVVTAHALGFHVDAVGAVEIFDDAAVGARSRSGSDAG